MDKKKLDETFALAFENHKNNNLQIAENLYKEKKVRINDPIDVDVYSGCRFYSRCPYSDEKCKKEPPLENINNKRNVACFFPLD